VATKLQTLIGGQRAARREGHPGAASVPGEVLVFRGRAARQPGVRKAPGQRHRPQITVMSADSQPALRHRHGDVADVVIKGVIVGDETNTVRHHRRQWSRPGRAAHPAGKFATVTRNHPHPETLEPATTARPDHRDGSRRPDGLATNVQ